MRRCARTLVITKYAARSPSRIFRHGKHPATSRDGGLMRKRQLNPKRQLLLGERAQAMRHAATDSEAALWRLLSGRKLGVQFRRQVPLAGRYICRLPGSFGTPRRRSRWRLASRPRHRRRTPRPRAGQARLSRPAPRSEPRSLPASERARTHPGCAGGWLSLTACKPAPTAPESPTPPRALPPRPRPAASAHTRPRASAPSVSPSPS